MTADKDQLFLFDENNWDIKKEKDPLAGSEDIFRDIEVEPGGDPDSKENLRLKYKGAPKLAADNNLLSKSQIKNLITDMRLVTSMSK